LSVVVDKEELVQVRRRHKVVSHPYLLQRVTPVVGAGVVEVLLKFSQ
jgi:hypothetical protein